MNRCTAKTAKGKPCKGRALEGTELCAAHLGVNGRKTALTPDVADHIVRLLKSGSYVDVACAAAGVGRSSFYEWYARGELDTGSRAFRDFRERVDKARAQGEAINVAHIANAAAKDWKAAAWLLAHQYPDRWGRASMRQEESVDSSGQRSATLPADPFAEGDELAQKRRARIA